MEFKEIENNATFIVGHARSGTTLLRNLLDAHPQMVVFPVESHFFKWSDADDKAKAFFEKTPFAKYCSKYFEINIPDFKSALQHKLNVVKHSRDVLLALMEIYYDSLGFPGAEKKRWVEKTPEHLFFIPLFKKWFGAGLKVIYMYRDPRDTFISRRKKYPNTKLFDFCKSYLNCYRIYSHYKDFSDYFLPVKFEELLTNPQRELTKICEYLNINFHESLLTQTINGKAFHGNSRFGETLNTISLEPLGRYRGKLTTADQMYIENLLDAPMRTYKYGDKMTSTEFRPHAFCKDRLRLFLELHLAATKWMAKGILAR